MPLHYFYSSKQKFSNSLRKNSLREKIFNDVYHCTAIFFCVQTQFCKWRESVQDLCTGMMHNHRAAIFSRREFLSQNGDIFQICLYDLVRGGDVTLDWMTGSSLTGRQDRITTPKCVALYKQIYFLFLFYIKLLKLLKLFKLFRFLFVFVLAYS